MSLSSNEIRAKITQIHRTKTLDYGNAWKKRGELLSVIANIARKVDRIETIGDRPVAVQDESILDTYVDLFIYCLKYETLLADNDPAVAQHLGFSLDIARPLSDGVAGFEHLVQTFPFASPDQDTSLSTTADGVVAAFKALENCFGPGVLPTAPALERLSAVQTLAALASRGMIAKQFASGSSASARKVYSGTSVEMTPEDYDKMLQDVVAAALSGCSVVGILGVTSVSVSLVRDLAAAGLLDLIKGIFADGPAPLDQVGGVSVRPIENLAEHHLDALIVAADSDKEDLLIAALPHLRNIPRIILGGYGHFGFRDFHFAHISRNLLVPSLANGYPNTLVHLYQCLVNANRLDLEGVVAEFGMFKGGTTMFLSLVVEALGRHWKVLGFDTFGGFPAPRSPLDMYAHPDCVHTQIDETRRYLSGRDVEIVPGDVVLTAKRLQEENVVLTFVDTDNFTSASAALDVVVERTVVGGAIVFDHVAGTNRFLYTLGERMAARRLASDSRYFHLHGTGVFLRQS
jgi:hypothetical protein